MNQCSSCLYWTPGNIPDAFDLVPHVNWKIPGAEFRDALETQHRPGPWGTCGRENDADSPMFTNDASDYFAALRTRGTHYCSAYTELGQNERFRG